MAEENRDDMDRRGFLKASAAASAGAAFGLGSAEAEAQNTEKVTARSTIHPSEKGMPWGKIGDMTVSRLISGGNLISGWSHSRDLKYVSQLMRHYNTDEKVMDTLEKLEQRGVNTILCDPNEKTCRIFDKFWKQRGGSMQWISDTRPQEGDLATNIKRAIDRGASAVYVNGGWADRWKLDGKAHLLGESVAIGKDMGVPMGIGGHSLDTIIAAETGGYDADFYVKTLHHHDYWSCRPEQHNNPVARNPTDNYWARTPEQTIEFMNGVDKPWIAFKTLAAGAIHPKSGFRYAFEGGADFVCVGMFDWQVEQDVNLVKKFVSEVKSAGRERPWQA